MLLLNVISQIQNNFLDRRFLGEPLEDYLWFAGIILFTLLLRKTATRLLAGSGNIIARLFGSVGANKNRLGILIRKPLGKLVQTILYFIAFNFLQDLWSRYSWTPLMGNKGYVVHLDRLIDHIFLLLFIIFLGQVLSRIIDFIYHVQLEKAREEDNKDRAQLLPLMKEIGKLLMWTICFFWILGSVFNVNIPALITGLGIGGIAIALAAKESVENFFAAITILSDKPFEVGDYIKLGPVEGTAERIGFRSTRIRGADGSAYIIPNQKLVGENLINQSKRDTRVITLIVNIKYGVPYNDLQKIIAELKQMFPEVKHIKENTDVQLNSFDKETMQLLISYSLPHPLTEESTIDKIKQVINMRVYEIVNKYAAFYVPAINNSNNLNNNATTAK
jgi:MscS family membrane protein